jgi:hypothetical protein
MFFLQNLKTLNFQGTKLINEKIYFPVDEFPSFSQHKTNPLKLLEISKWFHFGHFATLKLSHEQY